MNSLRCLLLLASSFLGGCSTGTRLAYNHLDTLVMVEVGGLVELEPAQKQALDAEFKTVWDWHRQSELPAYASALRQFAAELDRGNPSRATVDRLGNLIDQRADLFAQRALPGAARLMASLSQPQVDALIAKQRKEIGKNLRKHANETAPERGERLTEDLVDSLEDWLGTVQPAQQTLIQQRITDAEARGALAPEREQTLALNNLKRFADALATRNQPGFAQNLMTLSEPADATGKAERDAAIERGRHYFASLAATFDANQRSHLAERLRRYAEDCDVLAAKPIEAPAP